MAMNDQLIESQAQENQEFQKFIASLPKDSGWRTSHLFLFQDFWCQPKEIKAIISIQKHYKSSDADIIIATIPKSGTTWLKALCFAIVNRAKFHAGRNNHPLLTANPHELVPFLEYKLFANDRIPDLQSLPQPRLFGTHMPLNTLRPCMSEGRIVYMCRSPLDNFVSMWHYLCKLRPDSLGPLRLEDAFDMYCRGVVGFGPYWDHMLAYWRRSRERPDEVLFLKYEDMKADIVSNVRRLAEFLGFPFSSEEEGSGEIGKIVDLCSFERMKELEVNKKGKGAIAADFENRDLFRKGSVGDWVNYLTPPMVERLRHVMEDKLVGSGLSFEIAG